MTDMEWLEQWYQAQCDGDWEHQHGITIDTVDNPGWWVRIVLVGTDLADRREEALIVTRGIPPVIVEQRENHSLTRDGSDDWLLCRIKDGAFDGAGDPKQLRAIIECFRAWATQSRTTGTSP